MFVGPLFVSYLNTLYLAVTVFGSSFDNAMVILLNVAQRYGEIKLRYNEGNPRMEGSQMFGIVVIFTALALYAINTVLIARLADLQRRALRLY